MLQKLQRQRLVVLRLCRLPASCAVLPHVAAMQHLQSLDLDVTADSVSSPGTTALPHSLTSLRLFDRSNTAQEVELPVRLQELSNLLQLELNSCALQPSVLASLTQLQSLDLEDCQLLPVDEPQQGVVALLQVLQALTCLQRLCLNNNNTLPEEVAEQSAHMFSALTASSQMTALCITAYDQPVPQAAVQFMLPAGRQLPQLQELGIAFNFADLPEQIGWCLDSADLSSIVSALPALRRLDVGGVVCEDADVSALSGLPASCQHLEVGGDAFDDRAAKVVAQLSQLTYLDWRYSPYFTDLGLEMLTALRGLDQLWMSDCHSINEEVCAAAGCADWFDLDMTSSSSDGPVWRQLKELCYSSPECVQECSQQWAEDHEAEVVENERLQQQLADSNARLADKGAEVERLRQALAELRGAV